MNDIHYVYPCRIDDYMEARQRGMTLVDKTRLIEKILLDRGTKSLLFTRPNGFGKTMNLTMLDAFFNSEYRGNTWFDGTYIAGKREFDRFRNNVPVIRLDMKEVVPESAAAGGSSMRLVSDHLSGFRYLLSSERITDWKRRQLEYAMNGKYGALGGLSLLAECLHDDHGIRPIVLIDDFDVPLIRTAGTDGYRHVAETMACGIGGLLKDNEHVWKSVIMASSLVGREHLFPAINSTLQSSILEGREYENCFGFTLAETESTYCRPGVPDIFAMKSHSSGWSVRGTDVLNPSMVIDLLSGMPGECMYQPSQPCRKVLDHALSRKDARTVISDILEDGPNARHLEIPVRLPEGGNLDAADVDDLLCILTQMGLFSVRGDGSGACHVGIPNEAVRRFLIDEINKHPVPA